MKVYLFKPRFAPLVEAGTKRQTIRPRRKRPTKVGDELSLRTWTGKPYRSKQRKLREGEKCKATHSIKIFTIEGDSLGIVLIDGKYATRDTYRDFAKADGFANWGEMREWFKAEHGLPFEGELIEW